MAAANILTLTTANFPELGDFEGYQSSFLRLLGFGLEGVDYSAEPTTLVTFTLEDAGAGTRLTIVESGFDAIPESRRAKAFSSNSGGWEAQAKNIQQFLGSAK